MRMSTLSGNVTLRAVGLAFVFLGFQLGCAEPRPVPETLGEIQSLHRLGGIYLASQPSVQDFQLLKEAGIRTLIDQRYPEETPFDEGAIVERLGMTYTNVPWNGPADLSDEVFDRYRQLLNESEQPLLLHCSSANRVGTVWLPWRVLDGGVSVETALEEARLVGLRLPAYEEAAVAYIRKRLALEG